MEAFRKSYFFPLECSLFSLLVSAVWVSVVLKIGLPLVVAAEKAEVPFVAREVAVGLVSYGFTIGTFMVVAALIGLAWWRLTLREHVLRLREWLR